ncbi:MAG: radical SAM protein [Candidatus Zhuqueibacterota bacterium]
MQRLSIPPLVSGGLILSYTCTSACQHCVYASSPKWRGWMSEAEAGQVIAQIGEHAPDQRGLHIGGGEPFLNFDLVLRAVEMCIEANVPIQYVETNASWCVDDDLAYAQLTDLRDSGLPAILISVSPFHNEFIPFERTNRAIEIARSIYGHYNVLVYTQYFYEQLQQHEATGKIPLSRYLNTVGHENAARSFLQFYDLIPCGRTVSRLNFLYQKNPADAFFNTNCLVEMTNPEHVHINLYGNYIPSFCAGLSLGKSWDLGRIYAGIDLSALPIIEILVDSGVEGLLKFAQDQFDYRVREDGYMAKCHLCQDIRAHIVSLTDQFEELAPIDFYRNL